MLKFADESMTVLTFFLLNGELSSSSNTDLATPTAKQSGLAWTSSLPSLHYTPPGIRPRPQGTSLILSLSTYSLSALCPPSVPRWVILFLGAVYTQLLGSNFYGARSCAGSITQWPWLVVLKTPTGMQGLWGTKTTGQTGGRAKQNIQKISSKS